MAEWWVGSEISEMVSAEGWQKSVQRWERTSLDHALLGRVPVMTGVRLSKGFLAKEFGWIRVATITLGVETVSTRVLRGTGNALPSLPAATSCVGIGSLAKEFGGVRVATVTLGGASVAFV